jgi:hypothetical protein
MLKSESLPRTPGVLRLLLLFLGSQWAEVFLDVWRLGQRMLRAKAHEGMYEVLELESQLVLADERGEKAVLHKREKVRFLQDNIIAYKDQAWGDGEIFAAYKCAPGEAVDRYQEGHRYRILISLRGTKNRGDVEEFHIERTIKNGFRKDVEDFQTEIDHVTRKLILSVVFPRKRHPKYVALIDQNLSRTKELDAQHRQTLPDGRQRWSWSTDNPRLFEAYILQWEW